MGQRTNGVLPNDKKGIEKVFIEGQDIDSTIAKIREEAKYLPTDMAVRKNREEVASFAYKVARSKAAVDKAGATLKAEYAEIPKRLTLTAAYTKKLLSLCRQRFASRLLGASREREYSATSSASSCSSKN